MITLRRARERYDDRRGKQEVWLSFYAQAAHDKLAEGFGGLVLLDEIRLPPGESITGHPHREAEVITYLLDGTLAYEESLGRAGLMQAGEFRRMSFARGPLPNETNVSRTNWTHLFQIGLRSEPGLQPAHECKRFSVAQRRDGMCLVASADARAGSLRIREDGLVYSAMLRRGQHLVHDLQEGRRAWLHVVSGEVALNDLVLTSGDGVGISAERSASFTALAESEVLFVDVT